MSRPTGRVLAVAVVLAAGAAAGWWFAGGQPSPAAAQPAGAPPPEVTVVEVKAADTPLPLQYAGRVAGFRVVEVRAQVGGILLKREFTEGAAVKVGDVLFRIDPRPYEATLARANAQVAQAQAALRLAEENFGRAEQLNQRGIATPRQLDDATAARDQARATLQAAEADLSTAKLNLEYTVIKASVAGPTAIGVPPEGTLIQAQQTLLTTITQLDPAYVNYSATERELREFQEMDRQRDKPLDWETIGVQIQFGDGTVYSRIGKPDAYSRTVDPRTGTIQIRAIFPNPEGGLLPGQFVRINLQGVTMPKAVVIPKRAINQGPQGPFVYVVDAQSNAQVRPVRLDRELNDVWIIREGLADGDRVIVDGVIRVRPNGPVRPVPAQPRPQASTSGARP
ncbi:MAG: efflux RND transporter periplasmic adaptor subunit [Phreatobacter sp.]|uniref:efflux RND transporter periplasmic adaptor subunit n=1 Tax=Phreatobacter sp. TaxID=1966341 RepID=UPI001A45A6B5|nr:efflux RND transporter periplasmic adaptor subunit [Phreatobacter sp.]MBL8571410.1 efflux RND transporter periplasmic adaptor subunit [Phreatobacter sp.]